MSQPVHAQNPQGSNVQSEPTHVEVLWGTRILDDGFTSIPNFLIRNYRALGLEHGEWGFICTLLSYKHDARDPYPEQDTLAMNLGVSVRQVRKWTDTLTEKGLIQIGRRRHTRNKQFGTLVYNFLPLINRALTFLGDKAIPAGAGEYDVVYDRNEPPVPEVPVGGPEEQQVPSVPQVPLKIKRENKQNTTITKTTRARGYSTFRIFLKRGVKRDPGSEIHSLNLDTLEAARVFGWNESTHDSRVQNTSTYEPQANDQTDIQATAKRTDVRVPETHETQPRFLRGTLPASLTGVSTSDKPNDYQSTPTDAYSEIETRMQMHMGRPYIAKQKDYIVIKEFLASDIPLDWILNGIDRVFATRPETRDRIRGFGYVAEVLKDDWGCELAKLAPVQPMHFEPRTSNAQQPKFDSRVGSPKRPMTDPSTAPPVRDERYEAFYRLFPNG